MSFSPISWKLKGWGWKAPLQIMWLKSHAQRGICWCRLPTSAWVFNISKYKDFATSLSNPCSFLLPFTPLIRFSSRCVLAFPNPPLYHPWVVSVFCSWVVPRFCYLHTPIFSFSFLGNSCSPMQASCHLCLIFCFL